MPHNPIRVVVGPANYFHIPEVSITCTIFSLMNNFLARCGSTANAPLLRHKPNCRLRLNCQGKAYFVSWSLQRKRRATTGGGVR